VMSFDAVETLALQGFQLLCRKNNPRTLLRQGFSIFVSADRLDLTQHRSLSRNCTLKTRYGRKLKLPQVEIPRCRGNLLKPVVRIVFVDRARLKSLGNEGIY
jgi:hypothetical protein